MIKVHNFGKIKISVSYMIIWLMLFVLFFHRFAIQLGVTENCKYILDVLNIILFGIAIENKIILSGKNKKFIICYIGIIIIGTVSNFINIGTWGAGISFYILDCRALIRFVLFFLSCKTLLNFYEIEKIFDWILKFHVINCIYIIYQYFTLQVDLFWMRGDNLNGFFGTSTGGNIYVNVLMVFTLIIIIDRWIKKKCSKFNFIFFIALNLVIAVLIELKAYYIEFIIVCILFIVPFIKKLRRKQLIKSIVIISFMFFLFLILIQLLYKIYPWMQGTMSSLGALIKTASSDENIGNIGRLTFLQNTFKEIFNDSFADALFGIGLGNASTNGTMTKFAQTFYNTTHYSWLSSAYIFIETGIVGLVMYFYSFIYIFISTKNENRYCQVAKIAGLISIFLVIYNETFRTESGYLMFLLISLGFLKQNEKYGVKDINEYRD